MMMPDAFLHSRVSVSSRKPLSSTFLFVVFTHTHRQQSDHLFSGIKKHLARNVAKSAKMLTAFREAGPGKFFLKVCMAMKTDVNVFV